MTAGDVVEVSARRHDALASTARTDGTERGIGGAADKTQPGRSELCANKGVWGEEGNRQRACEGDVPQEDEGGSQTGEARGKSVCGRLLEEQLREMESSVLELSRSLSFR